MVTDDDEGILIARSKDGDWDAYAALIHMHQRKIHALTFRMSGSTADAKDLAQETFIQAYRGLATFRGHATFSSWLYRIAINTCVRWRKNERRREASDREWMATDVNDRVPDARNERVQKALDLLPAKQRAAVILTQFDGMTHAEAAKVLGCAETTLSWRMFAARRRLMELLREETTIP